MIYIRVTFCYPKFIINLNKCKLLNRLYVKFDKDAFTYEDLIACAEGKLFGAGNAQLPMPPMLMFNKISKIDTEGGLHSKGE